MSITERSAWGIDTSDFRGVAKALRKAQPALAREVRTELRAGGQLVADEAKRIVEPYSKSIPPSLIVKVRGLTVSIEAGATGKTSTSTARALFSGGYGTSTAERARQGVENEGAIAGLLELGNHGSKKSASATRSGKFRHPVFGNTKNWVEQEMHPYLEPAAEKMIPEVEGLIVSALDKATRIIIFED